MFDNANGYTPTDQSLTDMVSQKINIQDLKYDAKKTNLLTIDWYGFSQIT